MNIALILAGGTGTRLGNDIPKQYIKVKDKPIIAYCMEVLEKHPEIHKMQIVAEETWRDCIREVAGDKLVGFSMPGQNRQLSILNGIEDILKYAKEDDVVLVHDAARPLLTAKIVTDCLEACKEHDGVMPAIPVKDTVYISEDGSIKKLLDRSKVVAGQAPEAFRLGKYYQANQALLPDDILKINGSTEPAILAGLDIVVIEGDERNFKVTTKEDLKRFQEIV